MLCLVFTRKAGGRDVADAITGLHCYSGLWACWGRYSLLEEPAVCDGRPCVSAATGEERPSNARLGRPWPGRSCLRLLAAAHWSSAQQQHRWWRPGFKLPSSQAARSREFFQYLRLLRRCAAPNWILLWLHCRCSVSVACLIYHDGLSATQQTATIMANNCRWLRLVSFGLCQVDLSMTTCPLLSFMFKKGISMGWKACPKSKFWRNRV